ncbi:glutathione peroxidase [Roseococcus sp. SYP-B2431]|uniref:glutathione peroxidase n=1 Tax=Roseococcus sp. SYP-B2431 TaxID=2496640 RepID=UPI00103B8FF1|nr:glutathione peroxidase [Roseococcus sp. SYP-B2431]TCH96340.1 glutathione peroxidase [Roseococcus sp. SYP-B2431]
MTTAFDFSARDLTGTEVPLERFRGQVLLIVNTASKCGFTPQYAGLEKLHVELSGRGFAVLGFPCNQFGAQEPGDAAEIASFCRLTYDVNFPLFGKVEVNGAGAHPLYVWLKTQAKGFLGTSSIKWNFTKFLVDRGGNVVRRHGPATKPQAIRSGIERLL